MTPRRPDLAVVLVGLNSPGYRSLALGYLRAYAQADKRLGGVAGFITIDLGYTTDPWWIAYRAIALEPDVVAFSVTCWNATAVYAAARIIRAALPSALIVLGGPEVGPIAEETLAGQPAVDAIVRGEGEITFAELLVARVKDRPLWRVEGVTARRDDTVVNADDRPLVGNLDTLPSPYLAGVMDIAEGLTYLESYRGCPHNCGYCYEGKGYGRLRHFSRERVAAEIEYVAGTRALGAFSFIDPVFNLTDDRLTWLSDVLAPYASRGVRLHTIEVDIERVDERAAELMRRAGVRSVETGPQSVGVRALELCRRGFDADRFRAGVAACKRAGIAVECDFIIGLPGDTVTDVLNGLEFAVSCEPDKIQISTLNVLPGTDLWLRAVEMGLAYNPDPPHEIIRTGEMSFTDLRQAELFGLTVARCHATRIGAH
ncbi:MAG: hypothetical protein CVT60_05435 [Actinobacteria bacterium HGW-Actinobacteria-10]|nr:MAG: hypothetical protein CVT60_05435 [Actinobacteria bacterium HGW-Actinobacteria-10]